MPIGILEGTSVATPECIVRRVGDRRARFFDLRHDRIHFCLARDIVTERALSRASRTQWHLGFMGDRCARPDGQLQAMLKFKEGDGAMLILRADDALRRQTEPIAIKPQRPFQIVNTEGNDRDPWLHSRTSAPLGAREAGDFDRLRFREEGVKVQRWTATRRETRVGFFAVDIGWQGMISLL